MASGHLADEQWAFIQPFVPLPSEAKIGVRIGVKAGSPGMSTV
jgi:hypothetical protein